MQYPKPVQYKGKGHQRQGRTTLIKPNNTVSYLQALTQLINRGLMVWSSWDWSNAQGANHCIYPALVSMARVAQLG